MQEYSDIAEWMLYKLKTDAHFKFYLMEKKQEQKVC